MPKRKAVDLGEETTEASPRRSTRVRTSKKEATAVNGTASSTAHKQDKTSKRSSGRTTGRKATKKKEPAAKVIAFFIGFFMPGRHWGCNVNAHFKMVRQQRT
jgi:hypothetical protein